MFIWEDPCFDYLSARLLKGRRDVDAGFAKTGDSSDGLVEGFLLGLVQVDLDDALDTAGTDDGRNTDIHILDAVLAVEVSGAGQNALLVLEVGFGHFDRG